LRICGRQLGIPVAHRAGVAEHRAGELHDRGAWDCGGADVVPVTFSSRMRTGGRWTGSTAPAAPTAASSGPGGEPSGAGPRLWLLSPKGPAWWGITWVPEGAAGMEASLTLHRGQLMPWAPCLSLDHTRVRLLHHRRAGEDVVAGIPRQLVPPGPRDTPRCPACRGAPSGSRDVLR